MIGCGFEGVYTPILDPDTLGHHVFQEAKIELKEEPYNRRVDRGL